MSCLGPNYNPNPPREWSRVQNFCSVTSDVPIDFHTAQMREKGNVLQYKANSSNLTRMQRYSQIARGKWTNRTTTWATQSDTYTNPNTHYLKRVNRDLNVNLYTGLPTTLPITCPTENAAQGNPTFVPATPSSMPPNVAPPKPPKPNAIMPPNHPAPAPLHETLPPSGPVPAALDPPIVENGGNLICGTVEDPCTGVSISQPIVLNCHPNTDSDVPGVFTELCWNDGMQTWYVRQRYIMSTATTGWPKNAKAIFPA